MESVTESVYCLITIFLAILSQDAGDNSPVDAMG